MRAHERTPNTEPRHKAWARAGVAPSVAGALAALLPLAAHAADEGRALEQPENFGTVALITILGAGGLLLVASLGRMYQKQRGIRWRFQDPDQPHDAAH